MPDVILQEAWVEPLLEAAPRPWSEAATLVWLRYVAGQCRAWAPYWVPSWVGADVRQHAARGEWPDAVSVSEVGGLPLDTAEHRLEGGLWVEQRRGGAA